MSKRKMICVSSVLLALSFAVCAFTIRFHRVDCAHCEKNIYMLSGLEMMMSYWRAIPILHRDCADYVATVAAPEAGMTTGQYFESKGWDLRHTDIKGKTWKELVRGERNE